MYGHPYGSQPQQGYSSQEYPPQPQPASASSASRSREDRPPRHHSSSRSIGDPLNFTSGQFSGQLIRAELVELQKADLGRKYARKDRRPLDPPPVVQLRLYKVQSDQREVEVENYDNMGLICHVDLFPVPPQESSLREGSTYPYTFPAPQPPYQGAGMPPHGAPSVGMPMQLPPMHIPPTSQYTHDPATASHHPSHPPQEFDVVHIHQNHPITESSKCTEALAGTTFVQASNLDYKGNKVLMFVFSDLAVKMEGNFILRYRCFDLFSKVSTDEGETPVWAQCYGGQFRVYSTKEFPGLRASTDLTKHLSYFGVRLNLRETERKRRKKVDDPAALAAAANKGKGKRRDEGDGGEGGYRQYDD
ncbi:developmental regulator VosA [Heterobasidion irregulare TC 32-1]|uniref:Developmental regulator VosA n=1 Tax=Heterobasidion irregulare (strain TC 32-1) TaxID=747525 RepID=W4JWD4_HETIT|nr:developmental regulator VosA [Heterobasidion irregulare TC 32-1]ETW77395.1 developmental regulator VosA [Heterobasidion irregulare TC 32-1]